MSIDYSARSPADYIMHRDPMLLIDKIRHVEGRRIITEAKIKAASIFFQAEEGIPSWVGLEYLAQSAAIWTGIDDERAGRPINLGFLLGSRDYVAEQASFAEHEVLTIDVNVDFLEDRVIVFSGQISDKQNKILVKGNLTAFRPADIDQYLEGNH